MQTRPLGRHVELIGQPVNKILRLERISAMRLTHIPCFVQQNLQLYKPRLPIKGAHKGTHFHLIQWCQTHTMSAQTKVPLVILAVLACT